MGKRVVSPFRLNLQEAFRQGFKNTSYADMTRRQSGSGNNILGDGEGHEVGQTQFINGLFREVEKTPEQAKLGLTKEKNGKGEYQIVCDDDAKLAKVKYARDDEGNVSYTLK